MNETFFQQLVDQLYSSPVLMVVAACVTVGYVLRLWPWFPNAAIPTVVTILGSLFNLLLAPGPLPDVARRQWIVSHLVVGFVLGFAAWLFHNQVLARFEDMVPGLKTVLDATSWNKDLLASKSPGGTTRAGGSEVGEKEK